MSSFDTKLQLLEENQAGFWKKDLIFIKNDVNEALKSY
mgnify:CR=1 FL=1